MTFYKEFSPKPAQRIKSQISPSSARYAVYIPPLSHASCDLDLCIAMLILCTPLALSVQEATVSCTRLFSPSNGTISLTGLGVGHIARYTCSTGYTLEGSSARTCLAGGYWSGQQSNCWGKKTLGRYCNVPRKLLHSNVLFICSPIGPCPPLINPSNGTVVVNSTRVGGVAFYSCSTGYTRIGLSTRVCLTRETWSGVEPECISSE